LIDETKKSGNRVVGSISNFKLLVKQKKKKFKSLNITPHHYHL